MPKSEFEELVSDRKDWVRSSKKNKMDFGGILAGLYNDPTHFIYEILQNAEDAKAKEVRFILSEDGLDIHHDGEKLFDFKDIEGVTCIGNSTKKDDLNAIGKFGIGFKSVFAVTKTPHISSGEYNIRIEDFVVPVIISEGRWYSETIISLPFNHDQRTRGEIFDLISKKLDNIKLETLLFLTNIRKIRWETPSMSGLYSKSFETIQNYEGIQNTISVKRVNLTSLTDAREYVVIQKLINKELKADETIKNLNVAVAYGIKKGDNGHKIITREPDSKLVAFFPTEIDTFLDFLIQGPYKTTPTRETVPFEDEQNQIIIGETGNLIAESLPIMKRLGYLDVNFLGILPIISEHNESKIYSKIYEKVREKLLSDEPLLPTFDGKYTKASEALLAGVKDLPKILDENDNKKLFNKRSWLDTKITPDKTKELRDYIVYKLNIMEIDFEQFANKITSNFIQEKPDDWLIDFYSRLSKVESLWRNEWGVLRTKPIIRLETNEHIAPFNNQGIIQVYLPAKTKSKYKTVKRNLTENKDSLFFLTELGLNEPDNLAEIKEYILPRYQTGNKVKDEEYFEDFEKLLSIYEDENIASHKKNELAKLLLDSYFVDSVNYATGEHTLKKPAEVYVGDSDLEEYFRGISAVYFVSNELYEKFTSERLMNFLTDLGAEINVRRIEFNGNLSYEERARLRNNEKCTANVYQKDYKYEGLDEFIKQMTIIGSCVLWKLLLRNIEKLNSSDAEKFFNGEYCWFYYERKKKHFDAIFLKTLRKEAWLIDKEGNFMRPSDITFSKLSDEYIRDAPNIDILIKKLEFRPDAIDQVPEKIKPMLTFVYDLDKRGITVEDLERMIEKKEEVTEPRLEKVRHDWIPECKPNEVDVKIEEFEPKIVTSDLRGQSEGLEKGSSEKVKAVGENIPKEAISEMPSEADAKNIGKWGEEFTYLALEEHYKKIGPVIDTSFGFKVKQNNEEFEIVWLNKPGNTGIGCDFIIKKNGVETEYIEVKTKTQDEEELIEITGTQWEFARKLYDLSEGEKYFIYVVLNAGKKNPEIKFIRNPIKLWKDGKLYAHPIHFKL